MRAKLELAFYVLLNSPKTIWAFVLGVVFFALIIELGEHYAANLHFHGAMAGREDSIAHRLIRRYDKAALVALVSFWGLAIKCYRKDWKRLL